MAQGSVLVPYALALVVADGLHLEHGSGKITILGTFATVGSTKFPCVHPQIGVYMALTNGRGKSKVNLKLCDVDEEKPPLFTHTIDIDIPSPLAVIELCAQIVGVKFDLPGDYRLQLFVNDIFLMERRIVVLNLNEAPPDEYGNNAGNSNPNASTD